MTDAFLLHQLVERSASKAPDSLAVVDRERSLTYGELDRRANQLAQLLLDLGVKPGDRVGLYLDKSLESVVGIYGVLKSGGAFVPIDPQAPVPRIAYITQNCDVRVVITNAPRAEGWGGIAAAGSPVDDLIVLDATDVDAPTPVRVHGQGEVAQQSEMAPVVATIDLDLAYILYTSGSTGAPKGVKLTHRNALGFVNWAVEEFGVTSLDRLSCHAPFHFDLTVFDLYAAAHAGAALVLVPPKLSVFPTQITRFIEDNAITIWYSVPSILSMLTLRGGLSPGCFPTLRTLLFAGEVFPTKYLHQLMTLLPHVRFANLYGPTETNVCTWYEVPPLSDGDEAPIPIGRAIDDVEVFAVTEDGRRAEVGEVGELYVRGCTVMQGYWGDPERTEKVLTPNPFRPDLRDPVYRTGDLVQEDGEGNYAYLGRRDAQIKSRGYRIELGEIEAALYAHPSLLECAVIAVPDELVTNRIKALVVVRDDTDAQVLARFCSERIPHYMVPESFEFRDALEKTSTGKIDRQALSAQVIASTSKAGPPQGQPSFTPMLGSESSQHEAGGSRPAEEKKADAKR